MDAMTLISKGQTKALSVASDAPLSHVVLELGWDKAESPGLFGRLLKTEQPVDLDASCLMFDAAGTLIEKICTDRLVSACHSVRHSGDCTEGDSEGEDEIIAINLTSLPAEVATLIFTVTSFSGQTFDHVHNAYGRLIDLDSKRDLVSFDLTATGSHTGFVLARLYRDADGWHMQAIGETVEARRIDDIPPAVLSPWLTV